jgi:hypothetical protein
VIQTLKTVHWSEAARMEYWLRAKGRISEANVSVA